MTRDQLELVCGREGLTRPQTQAILDAADQYATSQARAAIDALGWPPADLHWQVLQPWSGAACDPKSGKPCTTDRGRVTCGACKQTRAWKAAA